MAYLIHKTLAASIIGMALATIQPASAAPGGLDKNFGIRGRVTTDIGGRYDICNSMVVQKDGKIVVSGRSALLGDDTSDFGMSRYNTDGTLDTTFGTGGKVVTTIRTYDDCRCMAIQADGRIILAGNSLGSFSLARYNADGTLDATFGSGGATVTAITDSIESGFSVAILADGKILLSGTCYNSSGFGIARYNPNGILDSTFGSDGTVITDFGGLHGYRTNMLVLPNGKFILQGNTWRGLSLNRYLANGKLDRSFGSEGQVTTEINGNDIHGECMAALPDGRIVVAGSHRFDPFQKYDLALFCYNNDGTLDSSFGNGGWLTRGIGNGASGARGMVIQPEGRIVVSGHAEAGNDEESLTLLRFYDDGSPDYSFGSDGVVIGPSDNDGYGSGAAVALQEDGRIVVAGSCQNAGGYDFTLARYEGRAQADIRAGYDKTVKRGNDFYEETSRLQTQHIDVRSGGGTKEIFVGIQNDGNDTDRFWIQGIDPGNRLSVEYLHDRINVTHRIAGGFLTGPVKPGEIYLLKIRIAAAPALHGLTRKISISARPEGGGSADQDVMTIKATAR